MKVHKAKVVKIHRQVTPSQQIWVDVNSQQDANYRNSVGLYVVENAEGEVIDSLTGQRLHPGDAGYAAAAIRQSVHTQQLQMTAADSNLLTQLPSGKLLAPYLIADGTAQQFLSQNTNNAVGTGPLAYFAYLGSYPDQKVTFAC